MTSKRGGRNNTQLNNDENDSGGTRMLTVFMCANNLS